jgi:acyl-coenzyme A synthetase/AMP-(fatty) acid ligase
MIVDCIYEWATQQPNATAVIWNDVSLSYRSFSNAIRSACDFLQRENLPIGRTAVVLASGLLDAWIIVMALRALGLNTISVRSIAAAQSLRVSDVACIIVIQTEAAAHNLTAQATGGVKVVTFPPSIYAAKYTNELLDAQHDVSPFGGHILYTSGTTGTYKKVMMRGEHEEGRNRARAQVLLLERNTIWHVIDYALWTSIGFKAPSATWYAGGCVVIDQRKENLKNFFLHNVNFAMLLTWQVKALLLAQGPSAHPINGFALTTAGGFVPIDIAKQCIQNLTDKVTVLYGSTETSTVPLESRFRTVDDLHWLAPTDYRLTQIVDDDGRECSIGQEGELRLLLSDFDCPNYLDDEEASARAFRDGYFYPGDMAVRREDGRIRILGRTADIVVLKGKKWATAPIEQEIQRALQVDEVCLFSGLSEQGLEELIVVIQSNHEIPRSQLDAVARLFPRFEYVRFSIRSEFPRTETGLRKTKRAQLKKLVFEELDRH